MDNHAGVDSQDRMEANQRLAARCEDSAIQKAEREIAAVLFVFQKLCGLPGEARPRVLRYVSELLAETD